MNLSNGIKITKVAAGATGATTAVNGTAVDMAGFEGVIFLATIATANAGNYLKAQIGTAADGGDAADLAGTKVVATANAEVVWLDIYRADPDQRYIRPVIIRGSSSATGDIYAIQYESRRQVIDNNITDTIIGNLVVNPYEGTA